MKECTSAECVERVRSIHQAAFEAFDWRRGAIEITEYLVQQHRVDVQDYVVKELGTVTDELDPVLFEGQVSTAIRRGFSSFYDKLSANIQEIRNPNEPHRLFYKEIRTATAYTKLSLIVTECA